MAGTESDVKPSVLIVDDEAGVRSALAGVLRDEDYRVEAVESGEAARRWREEAAPPARG